MGEETDGVVESTSKLQAKLKALTGVDILTDTGAYKDTYTILKEIGEVWDDLDSMDQAAALELMAGKNRANTLAAILGNVEDLNSAYESALNAEGSAMRENETYLNSIQGRIDLFNNAVQTMWMNFINDDTIKFIVDLGTKLVELADQIGLIPTALGGFTAFKLAAESVKEDFGDIGTAIREALNIFNTDADTDGVRNSIRDIIQATNDATEAQQEQTDATTEQSAAEQIRETIEEGANARELLETETMEEQTEVQEEQIDIQEQQTDATLDNVAAGEVNNAVTQTGTTAEATQTGVINQQTGAITRNTRSTDQDTFSTTRHTGATIRDTIATTARTVAQKALNIALTLGKSLLMGAGVGIAMMVFDRISGAISDAIHAEEKAIERADEALNKYRDDQEDLKDQKERVDELSESYTRLSSGVNTLTNDNIGLTVESYQEYLDVCNEIAKMYPELVKGYDAQGIAIVDLTGKVDGLTAAYKQSQEEAANTLLTDQNKQDVWTKYKAAGKIPGLVAHTTIDVSPQTKKNLLEAFFEMDDEEQQKVFDQRWNIMGMDVPDTLYNQLIERGITEDRYLLDRIYDDIFHERGIDRKQSDSLDDYKNQLLSKLAEINADISAGMSGIKAVTSASLIFNPIYQGLDDASKGVVQTLINNMSADMVYASSASNFDEFAKWFSENIIQNVANNQDMYSSLSAVSNNMAKAITNKDNTAFKTAQSEFSQMIQDWVDESGNVVVDPKADVVTQYFQKLAQDIQNQAKNYEVRVAIQTDFDSKESIDQILADYTGDAKEQIQNAIDGLGLEDGASMGDIYGTIRIGLDDGDGKLRTDEIDAIYDDYIDYLNNNGDMSEWSSAQVASIEALHAIAQLYGTDLDTIVSKLIELGYAYESLANVKSFDLRSKSTNEQIDKFQESIETIRDAWESLNSGDMTKSDFIDLAQEFPELMNGVNFSDDNWMTKAKTNLEALNKSVIAGKDGFLKSLNNMRDAMETRGEDVTVIDSMIAYVKSLLELPPVADELQANTVTGLTEAYEQYKTIMAETSEVLYDGQKVADSYYDSLKEYIDDTDALNTCFDENNKQIVTNVDALKELIAQQKEANINSAKLAKTQAQLKYYELVRQLGDLTRTVMVYSAENNVLADELREQINITKNAISQYQLLEDSLLGVTNAFEQFTQAKELDGQNTYGASYVEMVQTMYDALYKTGEVGSAQFWAAVEANVPDNIYKNLVSGQEQLKAISNYLNENVFSTLTLDDGSFSIDYTDIEKFVKKAQKKGVFFGTDASLFGLSADFIYGLEEGENALEVFAKSMEMTVPQVYAMLSELDKYTADGAGLSMLLQLDQSTTGQITYATSLLERLYAERQLLLKQGADNDTLKANEAQIAKYEAHIAGLKKQATDTVKSYTAAYTAIENALADTSQRISDVFSNDLIAKIGIDGNKTVEEELEKIKGYLYGLEEPTVVELEIAKQNIEDELDDIVDDIGQEKLQANVEINSKTGLYEIKDGELTVDASELKRYVNLMNASSFIDKSLENALSTTDQFLKTIDENVNTIAQEVTKSDQDSEETKPAEPTEQQPSPQRTTTQTDGSTTHESSSGNIHGGAGGSYGNIPQSGKPEINQAEVEYNLGLESDIWDTMDELAKRAAQLEMEPPSFETANALVSIRELMSQASALWGEYNNPDSIVPSADLRAQLSELQTKAAKWGVNITQNFDAEPGEVVAEVSATTEAIDAQKDATEGLGDITQDATSEAEALMQAYASNREALAALEAIDDKTMELDADTAMAFGIQLNEGEVITVEALINRIKRAQEGITASSLWKPEALEETSTVIYTYSALAEQLTNFQDILTQTDEIISDGTEVTQDYKDSLEDLGLTSEDISACFEDNNELVVTNANLLKNLVKNSDKNVATNIKLAKSQAQLKYYELYKKIAKLTDGTKVTDGATLNYINSLYSQMEAIDQAIAQYSILEAKLLGAANAYDKLANAQAIDSENDYGSKAEEMVNVLANAFNTAELGTQAAQTAIAGLIPNEVIDKTKTPDEQMQQIYDYFTKGEVSKLFTIEFDDDGGISSVEMTKENVEAFTNELLAADEIFHGTWDEFTLDESITSLDDFAKKIGVTKEVAFAYLTELEKIDIGWLGGDYETLLDQLMGDNLEYNIQKTIKELAKLKKEKASLMEGGITNEEQERINQINARIDELNSTMDVHKSTAYETWQVYSEIDKVLADTANMGKNVSEVFSSDLIQEVGLTGEETVEEAYDKLLAYQIKLGQPTELIFQLASEQAQAELDSLQKELEDKGIDIEANVKLNTETGEWEYTGDTTGLDDADKTTLQNYLDTYGDLYTINQTLEKSIESVETNAQRTADAVESIDKKIGEETSETTGTDSGQEDATTVVSEHTTVETTGDTTDSIGNTAAGTPNEITGVQATVSAITEVEGGATVNLPSIQNLDGKVSTYTEVETGASTDDLNPSTTAEVSGYTMPDNVVVSTENVEPNVSATVSSYGLPDEVVDTECVNPNVTGNVTGYNPLGEDVITANVNPSVTGNVTGYQLTNPAPSTANVNPNVTGVVTKYDEVNTESGADTSNLNPVVGAKVDSYTEVDDGADKSKLNPSGITASVSAYIEAPSVDKSQLAQDITARIVAYDDTGATVPDTLGGGVADTGADGTGQVVVQSDGHTPIVPSDFVPAEPVVTWHDLDQALENTYGDLDAALAELGITPDVANQLYKQSGAEGYVPPDTLKEYLATGVYARTPSDAMYEVVRVVEDTGDLNQALTDANLTLNEFEQLMRQYYWNGKVLEPDGGIEVWGAEWAASRHRDSATSRVKSIDWWYDEYQGDLDRLWELFPIEDAERWFAGSAYAQDYASLLDYLQRKPATVEVAPADTPVQENGADNVENGESPALTDEEMSSLLSYLKSRIEHNQQSQQHSSVKMESDAEDTRTLSQKVDDVLSAMMETGGDFNKSLELANVSLEDLATYWQGAMGKNPTEDDVRNFAQEIYNRRTQPMLPNNDQDVQTKEDTSLDTRTLSQKAVEVQQAMIDNGGNLDEALKTAKLSLEELATCWKSAMGTMNPTEDDVRNLAQEIYNHHFLGKAFTIDETLRSFSTNPETGNIDFDTTIFTQIMEEAGYASDETEELINKILQCAEVVEKASDPDPLWITEDGLAIDDLRYALTNLGVAYEEVLNNDDLTLAINIPNLVDQLKERGWTNSAIQTYIQQLSETDFEGFTITLDGVESIDEISTMLNEVPEGEQTDYNVSGDGASTLANINEQWSKVPKNVSTNYTIKTTTESSFNLFDPTTWFVNGTAHAQGTAHKSGSWGAPKTETALVGELGPELRVRGNKWELLGERGAEFRDVRKNDINK